MTLLLINSQYPLKAAMNYVLSVVMLSFPTDVLHLIHSGGDETHLVTPPTTVLNARRFSPPACRLKIPSLSGNKH